MGPPSYSSSRKHNSCSRPGLDRLEPRSPAAGFGGQTAAFEEYALELLNDIRFLPAAYTATINSPNGLQPFSQTGLAPTQPLAVDPRIARAAELHSQDMLSVGYFKHSSPHGDPDVRIRNAGFPALGGAEVIDFSGTPPRMFESPADQQTAWLSEIHEHLAGLITDTNNLSTSDPLGHRRILLDLGGFVRNLRAVGVGVADGTLPEKLDPSLPVPRSLISQGAFFTMDFARMKTIKSYLTGAVFNDVNGTGAYEPGEGLPGVTVTVAHGGQVTTLAAGGFSIALKPGVYTVTAHGPGLSQPVTRTIVMGKDNLRLEIPSNLNGQAVSISVGSTVTTTLGTIGALPANPVPSVDPLPRTDPSPDAGRIDWGDGTASTATIQPNGSGGYLVIGTHRSTHAGTFEYRTLVVRQDGGRDVLNGIVVVKPH
jgi:hypothetical protein